MLMSHDIRQDEELSTARRANVLGMDYFDTYKNKRPLFKQVLAVGDIRKYRVVPLFADEHNILLV